MAQTLDTGVVIPAPGDRISAAGVQEMRTLGVSVNSGLALTQAQAAQADLQSRARDEALEALIAGMEGMTYTGAWEPGRTYRINDVVAHGGDSWARLTAGASGEPGASPADWGLVARKGDGGGFGELTETATPGLWEGVDAGIEARLAALEYDSGERNVTSRVSDVVSGRVLVWRLGRTVFLTFDALVVTVPETPHWHTMTGLLPAGFRPPGINRFFQFAQQVANRASGPARVSSSGTAVIYNAKSGAGNSLVMEGTISFPAEAALPTSLPGTPA